MCVCVRACVYTYIYVHVYQFSYMSIKACTYTHSEIHTDICGSTHVFGGRGNIGRLFVCVHVSVCTCARVCTCIRVHMYVCTQACMYVCRHVLHIQVHICMHVCATHTSMHYTHASYHSLLPAVGRHLSTPFGFQLIPAPYMCRYVSCMHK